MSDQPQRPPGPDLRRGVALENLEEGRPLAGRVGDEAVILVRHGGTISAVGGTCPHYGAPLSEGLVVGDTLRCPWHHACFSLHTGEMLSPPALDDLPCWTVVVDGGRAVVTGRAAPAPLARLERGSGPGAVVIVGAGAAGAVAALTLRDEGWGGALTLVDPDPDAPYDRPNLSKDFLAGTAPEAWLPLRPPEFFESRDVERRLDSVARIAPADGMVELAQGGRLYYDALLLATGARPRSLDVPGADLPHVVVLRSLADCREIIRKAEDARHVLVVGAGFIGMEAAASLRRRDLEVTVVAPDPVPFQKPLGSALGERVQRLQVEHGVHMHLGRSVMRVEPDRAILDDGSSLPADLVLVAVGVRPDTRLAEDAGLAVDDGVVVDAHLATSVPGIWAAGDLARFPEARTGEPVRIEHWVVAERQGQVAARNMLGRRERFDAPPFFWTSLHDTTITCVGHAHRRDEIQVEGDLDAGHGVVRYMDEGEAVALAAIGRDMESLEAEAALQRRHPRDGSSVSAG